MYPSAHKGFRTAVDIQAYFFLIRPLCFLLYNARFIFAFCKYPGSFCLGPCTDGICFGLFFGYTGQQDLLDGSRAYFRYILAVPVL